MSFDVPLSVLLDERSPRAEGSRLLPHQAAALARMRAVESGDAAADYRTRIGAYCDPSGCGKSRVIAALCGEASTAAPCGEASTAAPCGEASTAAPDVARVLSACDGLMSWTDRTDGGGRTSRTSVIVAPGHTCNQWRGHLAHLGDDVVYVTKGTLKSLAALAAAMRANQPAVVLCSDASAPAVSFVFASVGVSARRAVYDEADTLGLYREFPAAMHWMVTAAVDALYITNALCCFLLPGKLIRGWCRAMFEDAEDVRYLALVRCTPAFVRESVDGVRPEQVTLTVTCSARPGPSPECAGNVANALADGDVDYALSFLHSVECVDRCANRIAEMWRARAHTVEAVATMAQPSVAQKSLLETAELFRNRAAVVRDKLGRPEECAICLKHPERDVAYLECCGATMCFGCAARWICDKETCPMCRAKASINTTVHVATDRVPRRPMGREGNTRAIVDAVLAADPAARLLLCCADPEVARTTFGLGEDDPDYRLKTLQDYVAGAESVLRLTSDLRFRGLDLSCTTDVVVVHPTCPRFYDRVVGAARRCGRGGRVRVWNLIDAGYERGPRGATIEELIARNVAYVKGPCEPRRAASPGRLSREAPEAM